MFQGVPILFFPSFPIFSHLVGGFNHLEKYESQWEGLSHILWKKMLETTNQPCVYSFVATWLVVFTNWAPRVGAPPLSSLHPLPETATYVPWGDLLSYN